MRWILSYLSGVNAFMLAVALLQLGAAIMEVRRRNMNLAGLYALYALQSFLLSRVR